MRRGMIAQVGAETLYLMMKTAAATLGDNLAPSRYQGVPLQPSGRPEYLCSRQRARDEVASAFEVASEGARLESRTANFTITEESS